ncbi:hypothetical protein [Spirosoma areae]
MLTDKLLTRLQPMIGFRANTFNPADANNYGLTDELKKTSTGLTVDQCHELLQLPTLFAVYPNKLANFGDFLKQTRDDAIRSLLTTLDTRLAEVGLAARLLNPTTLFKGTPAATAVIEKAGNSVGFQLRLQKSDVTVTLDRLLFSGLCDEGFALTLTNEETGEETPISIGEAGIWQDVAIQLSAGYGYLLLYDEAGLGESNAARNTITQWPRAKSGCQGCWAGCLNSYVAIDSIKVSSSGTTITKDTNYGLNLVFSAEGDVSGRLVDNPKRLLPLLRQQMAMTFLEKIAYSTRKNPDTEDAIQGALFALTDKDNANRVPVLYERALASLVKAMQAEASVAIDVNQADEISWSSI